MKVQKGPIIINGPGLNIQNIKLFSLGNIKILPNMQKKNFWNFSADSLDCGQILDNLEINPQVRTTVINYTVLLRYYLNLQCYLSIVFTSLSKLTTNVFPSTLVASLFHSLWSELTCSMKSLNKTCFWHFLSRQTISRKIQPFWWSSKSLALRKRSMVL